jgi:hypothetical protein
MFFLCSWVCWFYAGHAKGTEPAFSRAVLLVQHTSFVVSAPATVLPMLTLLRCLAAVY